MRDATWAGNPRRTTQRRQRSLGSAPALLRRPGAAAWRAGHRGAIALHPNANLDPALAFGTNAGVLPPTVRMAGLTQASAVGVFNAALHRGNLATLCSLRPTQTAVSGAMAQNMRPVSPRLVAFVQMGISLVGPEERGQWLAQWASTRIATADPLDRAWIPLVRRASKRRRLARKRPGERGGWPRTAIGARRACWGVKETSASHWRSAPADEPPRGLKCI